jgi:hypothetical protein
MARKSWDELTPKYRERLRRQGITEESHASGASLFHARGHKSSAHEALQRYRNTVLKWSRQYADTYNYLQRTPADIAAELMQYPKADVLEAINRQREMERLYRSGKYKRASRVYQQRNRDLPDWMNNYHWWFA